MADPVLLSDCKVWLGPVDLTGTVNAIRLGASKVELTDARMGDTLAVKYPGLVQLECSTSGFFGAGSGDSDPTIWGRFSSYAAGTPLSFCPPWSPAASAGAALNLAYVACGPQLSYETWGEHGSLLPYTFRTAPESTKRGIYRQTISIPKTTATNAATTGSGSLLGLLAAGYQAVVTYHLFAISGGTSLTLTLESDDDAGFGSATSRGTAVLTTAGGTVSGQFTVVGAIATDTYWRVTATNAGVVTYTVAASMSIEPV
jgi:hypothetical protein